MTQGDLFASLAARVAAWARVHDGAAFWQMTDAFPEANACEVDIAAREAGVLRWRDGKFEVGRSERAAEGERL